MDEPLISVLTPAFNSGATIGLALSSLMAQTYGCWEAVVVDDGSTDDTWERSFEIRDERIRRYRLGENSGRGRARQFALEKSQGSLICMLDADDWYYPWKLEVQHNLMEMHPKAALIGSAIASVDVNGGLTGVWHRPSSDCDRLLEPPGSLFGFGFPHASCMIRAHLARAQPYWRKLIRGEDFHFLARVLKGRRYYISSRILYSYSEEASYLRQGPVQRYFWSALASGSLLRRFPASASLLCGLRILQGGLALLLGGRRMGVRTRPAPPSSEEFDEYHRARHLVETAWNASGPPGGSLDLPWSASRDSRPWFRDCF